jgi:RNA polymerase sigma-70 factor (ECF subfamily)
MCGGWCLSRADADDVMQEISVVLWEKFDSFRDGADFKAWAFGVARFEVLAWLRDRGRDRLVLDEEVITKIAEETTADEPRLERQREALEHCMKKCPVISAICSCRPISPSRAFRRSRRAAGAR